MVLQVHRVYQDLKVSLDYVVHLGLLEMLVFLEKRVHPDSLACLEMLDRKDKRELEVDEEARVTEEK